MSIQFFYICIREKRAYDFNELIVKYRIINYQTINLIGKLILSGDEVKYNINWYIKRCVSRRVWSVIYTSMIFLNCNCFGSSIQRTNQWYAYLDKFQSICSKGTWVFFLSWSRYIVSISNACCIVGKITPKINW